MFVCMTSLHCFFLLLFILLHCSCQTTNDLSATESKVKECFRNKRLIFVGDSLTRYQYVNLVHFLYTGRWRTSSPQLEWEKNFLNWNTFYMLGSLRMGCYEICDCYREEGVAEDKENRFYFDPVYNITIHFVAWCPSVVAPILMNDIPSIHEHGMYCANVSFFKGKWSNVSLTYTKKYASNKLESLRLFFDEVIRPQNPDVVVVNQGHWQGFKEFRASNAVLKDFAAIVRRSSKKAVWKTTTASRSSSEPIDSPTFLQQISDAHLHIFDAYALTANLSKDSRSFVDNVHFMPFVYSIVNQKFITEVMCSSVPGHT